MATMTFQINDSSTGGTNPAVWVSVTENTDGTLTFNVTQEGGVIGDLRGLFFDVADESILSSLKVIAASTDVRIGDDSIKDLGDGANMNGLLGSDKGYDVGIEVGSAGIGKGDDIRSYSFTLDSSARDLSLADFANVDFAARLTSVGVIGGTRADSSKILEITSQAIDAKSDLVAADENTAAAGNVLANDATAGGSNTVTGWSGGAVGATVALESEGDTIGSLRLNADGSYVLDTSAGDELSAGESIVYNFTYGVRNQTEATSWSDDTSALTVVVNGRNDGPEAKDDAAGAIAEDGRIDGSVATNDSDIDRLDTHTWAVVDGSFNGLGQLAMNADGTWSYDANGAYDGLNEGESRELSFQYTMTDNHGAIDTATVSFTVFGVGTAEPPPPPPQDPALTYLFNHGSGQYDHGFFPQSGHDNTAEGFTGNDTLKIAGYGDADDLTITEGNYGLGDPTVDDTMFVIGIDGNRHSTRTEDTGYLVDYTGLTADQIQVTGNSDIDMIFA